MMSNNLNVVTINLNGIRSAGRKGIFTWLNDLSPDIICVQETKAQIELLQPDDYLLDGYYSKFSCAEKKGYSGVGIYAKQQPTNVIQHCGLDWYCISVKTEGLVMTQ